jgi:hypothetical protein
VTFEVGAVTFTGAEVLARENQPTLVAGRQVASTRRCLQVPLPPADVQPIVAAVRHGTAVR